MAGTTHVWLLSLGAPPSPQGAGAWVAALWADPDAVTTALPWLRRLLSWLAARWSAPALARRCEALDSETLRWAEVELQARDLGRVLGAHYAVRPVMRYAGPSAAQAAKDLRKGDRVILLPVEAQVSGPTTVSPTRHALSALAGLPVTVAQVQGYPDHPAYVEAVAETLREALVDLPAGVGDYQVLFCARGLPGRPGPYPDQLQATARAVAARCRLGRPWHLAYTTTPGLGRPLRPLATEQAAALGQQGARCLVLVPLGLSSEHVETRIELDREVAAAARAAGVRHVQRAPTVATRPTFVRALAELVRQAEDRAGWDVPWRPRSANSDTPSRDDQRPTAGKAG